jgi:hypothetical protein
MSQVIGIVPPILPLHNPTIYSAAAILKPQNKYSTDSGSDIELDTELVSCGRHDGHFRVSFTLPRTPE